MGYFAVTRQAGPGWDPDKTMREQPGWREHAVFMDSLAAEGFVIFGGPLADSDRGRVRALLIFQASSAEQIRRRLDEDPWTATGHLTSHIESWELAMGSERMDAATHVPEP